MSRFLDFEIISVFLDLACIALARSQTLPCLILGLQKISTKLLTTMNQMQLFDIAPLFPTDDAWAY